MSLRKRIARARRDFIELFNLGSSAVDLTGWSVQPVSEFNYNGASAAL